MPGSVPPGRDLRDAGAEPLTALGVALCIVVSLPSSPYPLAPELTAACRFTTGKTPRAWAKAAEAQRGAALLAATALMMLIRTAGYRAIGRD